MKHDRERAEWIVAAIVNNAPSDKYPSHREWATRKRKMIDPRDCGNGRRIVHRTSTWRTLFFISKVQHQKHPNYRFLSDYYPKYTFDVGKYLSPRLKLRKDDVYVVAEMNMTAETKH